MDLRFHPTLLPSSKLSFSLYSFLSVLIFCLSQTIPCQALVIMTPSKFCWYAPTMSCQTFLEFANFYWKFILNYSKIAEPMYDLLKKNKRFEWTDRQQSAFITLKETFTIVSILRYFNPIKLAILETDASDYVVSEVLSQEHKGRTYPIAFYSHRITPAQCNYEIYDKELLHQHSWY